MPQQIDVKPCFNFDRGKVRLHYFKNQRRKKPSLNELSCKKKNIKLTKKKLEYYITGMKKNQNFTLKKQKDKGE